MSSALSGLRPLLEDVRTTCAREGIDAELQDRLSRLAHRLDEPLTVAIAGKVKAGKSTLLNSLVGEELAPTDASECTQIVTWYRNGPTYKVMIDIDDGTSRQIPFRREDGALELDFGHVPAERITRITIDWPSQRLADMTLIDTPGLDSVNTHFSERTRVLLGASEHGDDDPDAGNSEADAVIYLMRHVHRTDLTFLEAFRDDAKAGASPISAIAVLSRADEVGVCRLDAMSAAQRVADNWRKDPRLRRLVQTVTPVAGLVAQAGASLREDEYRAIATLAALPRDQIDALLLTADRFVADSPCGVTPIEREHLLDRFGVYGVRLAISLVRLGAAPSASALAPEMTNRSGVGALRGLLGSVLTERRDILKARVALAGIDFALSQLPGPAFEPMRSELERIEANTHEFAEVHLLNAVRAGELRFRQKEINELERLFGSIGASPAQRLGFEAESDDAAVHAAVLDGVQRWRSRSENPLTSLDLAQAARAVARTYEGFLTPN